ncbi:DUF4145 domain-containing protein [Bradyrhizobium sp. 170]|uniref:DUF4145 domain-containing protein n=1 Tax=Bradyrhizobium sp. 170 TaxID=2782641 RepID=UPI001FFED593|nr:DUF4145 domain-containing protein [Bradyrhizobium sp. 170]UPK01942.1 hypothetical protein IVB05_30535 [Bradyrhizobium sp. 170]
MDWKQFFASVISSLAWPSVVGVLLWLLKDQLISLASRIEELTLPGGTKAKFERKLDEGRDIVEQKASAEEEPLPIPDARTLTLAEVAPDAAITVAYRALEKQLLELRTIIGMSARSNIPQIVRYLVSHDMIDEKDGQLFDTLREARNAVAHGPSNVSVSKEDALDFTRQADFLSRVLSDVRKGFGQT